MTKAACIIPSSARHQDTAEQSFRMLRPGGTATIIGMVPLGIKIGLATISCATARSGARWAATAFRSACRGCCPWRQGRLKLDHLISNASSSLRS
jgi:S-(hydroxymethyl)glutathione dehydrogenase/alcohol dehydrogenase